MEKLRFMIIQGFWKVWWLDATAALLVGRSGSGAMGPRRLCVGQDGGRGLNYLRQTGR